MHLSKSVTQWMAIDLANTKVSTNWVVPDSTESRNREAQLISHLYRIELILILNRALIIPLII